MNYIIKYSAKKIKLSWYVSNIEFPMQKLTINKSEAFVFQTQEMANAMIKHLKKIRSYDWEKEEI